jgi:hypothetical protein
MDDSFIAGMAQRVPFIVADPGRDADPFMLHLFAALQRVRSSAMSPISPKRNQSAERCKYATPINSQPGVIPILEAVRKSRSVEPRRNH